MSKNVKLDEYDEIKLKKEKMFNKITGKEREFPKYTTQLINTANQNAQATRPKVVGQMSDLIKECPYNSYDGWRKWYLKRHPKAIDRATKKTMNMIEKMKVAMSKIDEEMVREWITDLVIDKTAEGLIIQEIILKTLAEKMDLDYSFANKEEESKGIDGYLGKKPVSIKPKSFLSKDSSVRDSIPYEIIYYKKTGKYLYIYKK